MWCVAGTPPLTTSLMATADRLSKVVVSSAVFKSCLAHATSTEGEEIMAVLLGDWSDGMAIVNCVVPLTRSVTPQTQTQSHAPSSRNSAC